MIDTNQSPILTRQPPVEHEAKCDSQVDCRIRDTGREGTSGTNLGAYLKANYTVFP
jgi:hypothetical protein